MTSGPQRKPMMAPRNSPKPRVAELGGNVGTWKITDAKDVKFPIEKEENAFEVSAPPPGEWLGGRCMVAAAVKIQRRR